MEQAVRDKPFNQLLAGVLPSPSRRCTDNGAWANRVVQDGCDQCIRVTRSDEVRPTTANLSEYRDVSGDDRTPEHGSLEHGKAKTFVVRQVDEAVCVVVQARELDIGQCREVKQAPAMLRVTTETIEQVVHPPARSPHEDKCVIVSGLPEALEGIEHARMLFARFKRGNDEMERPRRRGGGVARYPGKVCRRSAQEVATMREYLDRWRRVSQTLAQRLGYDSRRDEKQVGPHTQRV